MRLKHKLAAEALGTFLLIIAIVGSGIMAENLAPNNPALQLLANSIAVAATLIVIITLFTPTSGAHFNPLVSGLNLTQANKTEMIAYIFAQISAALLAVIIAHLMFDLPLLQISMKSRASVGVFVSEFIATFGLILLILMTKHLPYTKVASLIGLYILAAFWFTASTSFANPAVTIARSFTATATGIAPINALHFIIIQIIAALCAKVAAQSFFQKG
jgi:glycerol uptake facilitator-like aquaporin